jgi:hypothetical protein
MNCSGYLIQSVEHMKGTRWGGVFIFAGNCGDLASDLQNLVQFIGSRTASTSERVQTGHGTDVQTVAMWWLYHESKGGLILNDNDSLSSFEI